MANVTLNKQFGLLWHQLPFTQNKDIWARWSFLASRLWFSSLRTDSEIVNIKECLIFICIPGLAQYQLMGGWRKEGRNEQMEIN